MRVVIAGAGQAGQTVAATLRQEGFAGELLLLGDEPDLPYQRPPLSKSYMKDGDPARVLLKPAAFYAGAGIDFRPGARVLAIDRARAEVETAGGERIGYDHLVLATGARNAMPPIAGLATAGVLGLRTLADATALRARIAAAERTVVIGGGFIGLEFAAVARAAGLAVTVLEAGTRLMARVVSPEVSAFFLAAHRAAGIDIRLGAAAEALEPGRVHLSGGGTVAAPLILLATGVRPNGELAEAAGLAVADGIIVDDDLLTADPAISAIGDCARVPTRDGRLLRLESVQAAVDQARHLARRIQHGPRGPFEAVPWFWSDQGPYKLQIAGLLEPGAEQVVVPGPADRLSVLSFAGARLVAVETINAPAPHMAARRLLARADVPRRQALEAAGFDLVALARE